MHRIFCLLFIFISFHSIAQTDDTWSLERAVNYAIEHNLSIQQSVLNARLSKLTYIQSTVSQLPNINGSASRGRSYGRSVDPTTNQFVSGSSYDYMSLGGNADVLLFGWFQKRNTIRSNNFTSQAAQADLGQLTNDISLNVATGYLRALLAQQQILVSEKQVGLSKAQLDQTKKFAEAGKLPELNVAQLESQLANDSANLIGAYTEYTAALLDIKALLNFDFKTPFNITAPNIDIANLSVSLTPTPEEIYDVAVKNYGTIKSSKMKLKASERQLWSARGSLLPQLTMGAQLGSNWSSTTKDITAYNITGYNPNGSFVTADIPGIGLTKFDVYQPNVSYTTSDVAHNTQLDRNFRQTVSLSLNVPIFNGWQSQLAVKQAKFNMLNLQIAKTQAEVKLKQDIYKAHNDAKNSLQKYYAAERANNAAERAFDFAKKRYDLGLTNTVEYLTTQNTLYSASSNLARAKYDLIFKLKVIDYYLGKELKL
jgi:outer membrane protein